MALVSVMVNVSRSSWHLSVRRASSLREQERKTSYSESCLDETFKSY